MRGDNPSGDALDRLDGGIFVGRNRELTTIRASLRNVRLGHGHAVLVAGEPGIGKTSLVRNAERIAADEFGFRVLSSGCHSGGAPAFWPWKLLEEVAPDPRSGFATIVPIVTRLRAAIDAHPGSPTPPLSASRDDRFEFFDGVLRPLREAARLEPILLNLEDVHWADPDSVHLLRFCAQQIGNARVLALATYREHEIPVGSLKDLLAEIGSRPLGTRITMRGLSEIEVRELIEEVAGHTCAPVFAAQIYTLTEGNPLYIEGILRHLLSQGVFRYDGIRWTSRILPMDMPLPPSLEELIWQRLVRLSDECRQFLGAAAVMGRDFNPALLRELLELPQQWETRALAEASTGHLVQPKATGEYQFFHTLFREVLYARLASRERSTLHLRAGELLERHYATEADQHAAELAYHFSETTAARGQRKAVTYALKAARDAAAVMAHEEEARSLAAALRALDRWKNPDDAQRCDVLLLLADAQWRSGNFERARGNALGAADVARRIRCGTRLARAALANAGRLQGFGAVGCNDAVALLLREALGAIDENHELRPIVMARLAEELAFTPSDEIGRSLGQQAIQLARRQADPSVLAATLKTTHWALWTPEGVRDRLALADEIVQLAERAGDRSMRFDGELVRGWSFIELGERGPAESALSACAQLGNELRQPYYQWLTAVTRTCLALMTGQLHQVESLAQQALRIGESTQDPNCLLFFNGEMGHLCWLTGRFAELPRYYSEITDPHPLLAPTVSCARAGMLCDTGQTAQARAEFERWATDWFAQVPRNPTWLFTMSKLSQVCAALGDVVRAECLYDLLTPFDGRNVVIVPFFPYGAASHALGLLAATMRRWQDAERHFEDALAMNTRMGSTQWVARTQLAYAGMLLERLGPGDREQGRMLLMQSMETSAALGMPTVAQQARDTLARLRDDRSGERSRYITPAGLSSDPRDSVATPTRRAVFRCEGEYRTIEYREKTCRLRNIRGFDYLAPLVSAPGTPFSASALRRLAEGVDPSLSGICPPLDRYDCSERTTLDGNLGRPLDAVALRRYRQRIDELEAEEKEAAQTQRAAHARAEREFIEDEIIAAHRSGGRSVSEERNRQAVAKGIRKGIERIAGEFPDLGRHLATHVQTGLHCVYKRDPEHPLEWDV